MESDDRRSIVSFDERFELGMTHESHRTGVRYWVIAVKNQLDELKDQDGQTPELELEAAMTLASPHKELQTIEGCYPLGRDRAAHRLGLREMVAALRECLATHASVPPAAGQPLTLKVEAKLVAMPHPS